MKIWIEFGTAPPLIQVPIESPQVIEKPQVPLPEVNVTSVDSTKSLEEQKANETVSKPSEQQEAAPTPVTEPPPTPSVP